MRATKTTAKQTGQKKPQKIDPQGMAGGGSPRDGRRWSLNGKRWILKGWKEMDPQEMAGDRSSKGEGNRR